MPGVGGCADAAAGGSVHGATGEGEGSIMGREQGGGGQGPGEGIPNPESSDFGQFYRRVVCLPIFVIVYVTRRAHA